MLPPGLQYVAASGEVFPTNGAAVPTPGLAADFDGQAAMLDALAYLKAARAVGAPAALDYLSARFAGLPAVGNCLLA